MVFYSLQFKWAVWQATHRRLFEEVVKATALFLLPFETSGLCLVLAQLHMMRATRTAPLNLLKKWEAIQQEIAPGIEDPG